MRKGVSVKRKAQEAEAKRLLSSMERAIDSSAPVYTLRVAQRQIVEIAKAVRAIAKIIALHKPPPSLTPDEFERLVSVIGRPSAQGVSII